jgi:NIPSNAP
MKMFLSFVCGAVVMLGFNAMRGANPSHHVYELRMYHVNQGKTEALQARFRDYSDALFKRHNMKSVGYWVAEDAPASQNLFIYILEHPSRQEAEKNWAAFQADPEWKRVKSESEGKGRSWIISTDISWILPAIQRLIDLSGKLESRKRI